MIINSNMTSGMDTLEQTSRRKNVDKAGSINSQSGTNPVSELDAVTISEKGKDVSGITQLLKEMPDVREKRVAELKEKIASGNYNVSGRDIASKIVDTALEDTF